MRRLRWTNPSLPQTLQIAILFLYITAFFNVLGGLINIASIWGLINFLSGLIAFGAAQGMVRERKNGYRLALLFAAVDVLLTIYSVSGGFLRVVSHRPAAGDRPRGPARAPHEPRLLPHVVPLKALAMLTRRGERSEGDDLLGPGRERAVERMFDRAARRYDLLNRMLTFGLDRRWRRRSVGLLDLTTGVARGRPRLRHRGLLR